MNKFYEALSEVIAEFCVENEEKGRWVTIKGTHIFIEDGETVRDAFKSITGKDLNSNTNEEKPNKQNSNKTIHKNILDIENKNRNLSYEVGTVFDTNGNIIKEISTNNKGEIDLHGQDLSFMDGKIVTHNHPDGSPLSASDIATSFGDKIKLAEIRATTKQGATYSLKPNENYTKEKALEFAKDYSEVPLNSAKSFRDLCKEELAKGTLDIDFLKTNMDNLFKVYAWKQAEEFLKSKAKDYGFDYAKEE